MTKLRTDRPAARAGGQASTVPAAGARGRMWATVAAVGVLAVTVGIIWLGHIPAPAFPDLAAAPDSSVPGLVAYVDPGAERACVMVVEATGGQPRQLHCSREAAEGLGWTADGDVVALLYGELTPELAVIDAGDGAILQRLSAEAPRAERITRQLWQERTVFEGRRLTIGDTDGDARVRVHGPDGATQVLVAVEEAPRDYRFESAQFSPDGQWVLVRDSRGRILVVGADGTPGARQLVDPGEPGYTEPAWYIPGESAHTIDPADLG